MSGYRGGSSQSLSTKDFNERAKALSERLGPVGKPEKPIPKPRQKWSDRARPEAEPAPAEAAESGDAAEAAPAEPTDE